MTVRVSIFAAIAAVILLTVIFELIRSRRLHERYAMLWLITGGVIFVLAVWRDALGTLSPTRSASPTRLRRCSCSRRSSSSSCSCTTRR